jgi:hypothetical protein
MVLNMGSTISLVMLQPATLMLGHSSLTRSFRKSVQIRCWHTASALFMGIKLPPASPSFCAVSRARREEAMFEISLGRICKVSECQFQEQCSSWRLRSVVDMSKVGKPVCLCVVRYDLTSVSFGRHL